MLKSRAELQWLTPRHMLLAGFFFLFFFFVKQQTLLGSEHTVLWKQQHTITVQNLFSYWKASNEKFIYRIVSYQKRPCHVILCMLGHVCLSCAPSQWRDWWGIWQGTCFGAVINNYNHLWQHMYIYVFA